VSYLSHSAADNQRADAARFFVLSLFWLWFLSLVIRAQNRHFPDILSLLFLCFRLNSLSVISRFSRPKSEVL
jgi:asparagine N-glycosylation enzyme membrane subunit Stt3